MSKSWSCSQLQIELKTLDLILTLGLLSYPSLGWPCWLYGGSLVAQTVKNLPVIRRPGFDPWVGKIPWRREWLPTPVFLPGESVGQRSLVNYSPWDHSELDTFTFPLPGFILLLLRPPNSDKTNLQYSCFLPWGVAGDTFSWARQLISASVT